MAEVSWSLLREIRAFMDRLYAASPVGRIVRALLWPLLKGRMVYYVAWEDFRVAASGINPPGLVSDPARDQDGTFLFSPSAENLIAVICQMPHKWREKTAIRPHLHWRKTTDAAGDVAWEERHQVIGIGDLPPADWTAWAPAVGRSSEPGSTQAHVLDAFSEVSMEGQTLSTIVFFQIRRNPNAVKDTYAANAKLFEFDFHYQVDSAGSYQEYVKDDVE